MKRIVTAVVCTALAVLSAAPAFADAPARLQLQPDDNICIVGNTLAERMQHDGWLETRLHARFPDHELVVRNLGFSGDEIDHRIRSANFGSPDEWLGADAEPIGGYDENRFETVNTNADVIFAFFGYNEAYADEEGLDDFKTRLDDWIDHTRRQQYNGESAPRLVLFSPIAHENLHDPLLPPGTENNRRLVLYTEAMADVAASHDVPFVDLFHPTREAYESADRPLTINGVHLNTEGNRQLAEIIDHALFGDAPSHDVDDLEPLRQAVLDKNFHWFERYRARDGYSTWGSRAFLTFHRDIPNVANPDRVDEEGLLPTNYDVLQCELRILDAMTANRDRHIHALAQGRDHEIDDANVPDHIDPQTNAPGPGPDGEYPYLSGEEAIEQMTLPEGYQVNLFACEEQFPELANPVQMAFGPQGRLWVAAWHTYPHWQPQTDMNDKLLVFEDTTGDGRADEMTVFADDLHNPTGFEFHDGGVLLAQQPDLVFLKDTTGDGQADLRQRVLHGFDSADTHHAINSFTFDPGGALYMQEGTFHHTQVESPWQPTRRAANGAVFRFEPRTWKLDVHASYPFANPHGHVFDRWGRNIVVDATSATPIYGPSFGVKTVFPDKLAAPAPTVYRQRTRPAAAAEILTSRHFPDDVQGNFLIANVITVRGILNYRLSEDGAGLRGEEAELLVESDDENFRPVDLEVGPDGAIYFADWHNPIIGHMQHNLRDNSRDNEHGRVYRITHQNRDLLDPPPIADQPVGHLLDLLKEPENRLRYRARTELGSRDADEVLDALTDWLDNLDPDHEGYQLHRTEALWIHQRHHRVNEDLLEQQLRSDHPQARAAATRVLATWRDHLDDPLTLLRQQADDDDPAVRLEAVRAASLFNDPDAADVVRAAADHDQDRFLEYTIEQAMNTLDR